MDKYIEKLRENSFTRTFVFVVFFCLVGALLLITSSAETPNTSLEAESSSLTSPAKVISDSSASSGKAIEFGSTPPPPGSGYKNGIRLGIATGYPYVKDKDFPSKFSMSYSSYVNKVSSLGVSWIRTDAIINGTQPLNILDETLTAAKAKNIKVLAVFTYGDISQPDILVLRMAQYVDHWKSLGLTSAIGGYEMWNEPNNTGDSRFPFQDPAQFRTWLKKSYPILKDRTPGVPIVLGGFAPGGGNDPCCNGNLGNPADYLNKLYSLNGNSSSGMFDHVAMHPYANSSSNYPEGNNHPKSGMRVAHYLRKVMNSYGDQGKQIWGTEAGWLTCTNNSGGPAPFTEAQRTNRMINDLNEWFYGTHNSAGERTGYAASSDWNTGPFMIFKLYKAGTGGADDSHGLIYTNVQSCDGKPSGYEPPVVNGIKLYAGSSVDLIPSGIAN